MNLDLIDFSVSMQLVIWMWVLLVGLYMLNKGMKSKDEVVRESLPWMGGALIAIGGVAVVLQSLSDYVL